MIVFHMVILKRICLVTGVKNICALIDAGLNLWNSRVFDELVCDSYAADTDYLGGVLIDANPILKYCSTWEILQVRLINLQMVVGGGLYNPMK